MNDQRRMIDTLAKAGYRVGVQVDSAIGADGMHSEWFWRREFPRAYRWLFAADSASAPPSPRRARPARRPRAAASPTRP
ncbi:MAG TPA: hypothetical protein VFJ16_32060 [Longimicrobium sp.]|nr:hypothetical protein [Longimicrobium sp.]